MIITLTLKQSKSFAQTVANFSDYGIISIMYHRFEESKYPSTNIQLEVFKEQLSIIEIENIKFVNPNEFENELVNNKKQRKIYSSVGVFGFGLTALWMAQTNAFQNNSNLTMQLVALGICFGLILNELLMCFATMPAELTTTASAVNFFGTNIAKSLSGGLSGAISTVSSQGSWERFRVEIGVSQEAIANFKEPLHNHIQEGIEAGSWSQASLEIINHTISQQAEVITYINTATLTGFLLLAFGLLPFLHREGKSAKDVRSN